MTFIGLNSREPAKRASSLYHLGCRVTFEAKKEQVKQGLRPDQEAVLNIFLRAVKTHHTQALKEIGYESQR